MTIWTELALTYVEEIFWVYWDKSSEAGTARHKQRKAKKQIYECGEEGHVGWLYEGQTYKGQ